MTNGRFQHITVEESTICNDLKRGEYLNLYLNKYVLVLNTKTKLNDLRKIICLRKTKVSVLRISVYKDFEN